MTTPNQPPRPTEEIPRLPQRPATMHKGQAGHVAIVAGSSGMSGAAVLTGMGALRAGAGLARVLTPQSIQSIVATSEPCLMTVGGSEIDGIIDPTTFPLDAIADWAHALAAGPGLGQWPPVRLLVRRLIAETDVPLVLDADGLNTIATVSGDAEPAEWWQHLPDGRPVVITPHPGEMNRLRTAIGQDAFRGDDDETRLAVAHDYALRSGAVVLLKGHRTIVCDGQQAYVNTTGNPGMATGGMGDVLTGLIAALIAQGLDAFDAARLGAYVHGLSADHCAHHVAARGYLAREVADGLPAALAEATRVRIGFR